MKEIFIREETVDAEKIAVIPHGFDLARWKRAAENADDIRGEFNLQDKVVFVAVGRLYWFKDFANLLKAFAPIAARFPETVLMIVGQGVDREELERQAVELGIAKQTIFTGYRSDIAKILAASDIFVHSSLEESFGMVHVEAFALGKPIISTSVGIAAEIVKDNVNGFLVPPQNVSAMQKALEQMLSCRERWTEMGRNGEEKASEFAIEKIQPKCEEQYLAWLRQQNFAFNTNTASDKNQQVEF